MYCAAAVAVGILSDECRYGGVVHQVMSVEMVKKEEAVRWMMFSLLRFLEINL